MKKENQTVQEALRQYRKYRKRSNILSIIGFALFVLGIIGFVPMSFGIGPFGLLAIVPGFIVMIIGIYFGWKARDAFFDMAGFNFISIGMVNTRNLRNMDLYAKMVEQKLQENGPIDNGHVYQEPDFQTKDRYDYQEEKEEKADPVNSGTINCPRCGYINDVKANFCSQCGAPLPTNKNK